MDKTNASQFTPVSLPQLKTTSDGSHTLYVTEIDEHYHSVHGALRESEHIFIDAGFRYCKKDPVRILEVGFGTGLNALLTIIEAKRMGRNVIYTTIEKFPVEDNIIKQLNYPEITTVGTKDIFLKLHETPWNITTRLFQWFTVIKVKADITLFVPEEQYDLIYFDAFGPDKQPEVWNDSVIFSLTGTLSPGGIFVTYSVKGDLKRALKSAGMGIELLPGPPGKRHIMRAVKK